MMKLACTAILLILLISTRAFAAPARSGADPALAGQDAYLRGMTELSEGKWRAAESSFEASLALDPKFAPAADAAGYAAIARDDPSAALGHFRRAIALDSLYCEPREGLFFSLYLLGRTDEATGAFIDMVRTDFDHCFGRHESWKKHSALYREPRDAAAAYEAAYARDSTNAITILLHGNAVAAMGNVEAANSDWRLAFARDRRLSLMPLFYIDEGGTRPDSLLARDDVALAGGTEFAALRVMRGNNLLKLSRLPEAFADFQRAAALAPLATAPHVNMAVMLAFQGQPEAAESELVAAFRHSASFTRPYGITGDDDANTWLQMWTQHIQAHPESAIGWMFLGNARGATQDADGALDAYQRAASLAPGSAMAQLHLGTTYADLSDAGRALPALARVTELDSSLYCAHMHAALLLAQSDDAAGVLSELAPVVRMAPRDVVPYRLQGAAAGEAGKRSLAYSAFRVALSLDPGDAMTHKLRAGVRRKAGDRRGEILDLSRALQIVPNDTELLTLRAAAYRAVGKEAAAQADEAVLHGGSNGGGGAGEGYAPPPGSGREMCNICFGTGKQNCNFCYGRGSQRCNICNGTGRNYSGQGCYNCQYSGYGQGNTRCGNCSASGKTNCTFCFGAGYRNR